MPHHPGPFALWIQVVLEMEGTDRRLERGEKRWFMPLPCCGSEGLQYSETRDPVVQPLLPFHILPPSDRLAVTASAVATPWVAQHPFLVPLTIATPL